MPRPRKSINQINVVPYIDVMLVLLIIFMVTAPLINPGTIDLPSVGKQLSAPAAPPIEITVLDDGKMLVRDTSTSEPARRVEKDELVARIRSHLRNDKNQAVVIAADKSVRYESVIGIIDLLQQNQIGKVGLMARPTR
ncbi:MAG: protein TolR [Casimicrobiaceae bacterium]